MLPFCYSQERERFAAVLFCVKKHMDRRKGERDMSKNHGKTSGSVFSAVAVGLVVAVVAALIVCAAAAAMLSAGQLAEDTMEYAAALSLLVGAVAGCLVGASKMPQKRLLICAVIGAVFYACLFLAGTALFEGGVFYAGVTALMVLGSSLAAGLLQIGGKKQKSFRKRKRRIGSIVHVA